MKKNKNKLVVFNVNVALLLSLVTILTLAFPFASITTGTITTNSSGFNVLVGIINDKMYPQIVAIILLAVGILCILDAIGLLLVKIDAKKARIFLKINHVTQVVTSIIYTVTAVIYVVTYGPTEDTSVMTWTFIGTLISLIVFFVGFFLERNHK
ncbi:hypothetical protein [Paenibacillus terrigena]|uniref:hypothetical protein n=1 Tax=Paenibacillus terrigena TaxID=369333 RepID=UPI00037A489A|nr:hypothetical protein [Paenibacillus terrigena]